MTQLRRAAVAGLLALVALTIGAGGAAFSQQEQEEEDPYQDHILNTDKRILDGILGMVGLGGSEGATITYRERSPLVVPPDLKLPPPETHSIVQNPEWPVDPEVKQSKAAAAARKNDHRASVDPAKPISRSALEQSGTGTLPTGDRSGPAKTKEDDFFTMLYKGGLWGSQKNEDVETFTGEPPRDALTEPPPGYLTPSPVAPYGTTKRGFEVEKPEKL
ncbi:MAG: hypothetical protein WD073_09835 [Xanthobacteraceae bacterium]